MIQTLERLPGCKITAGECILVEGPSDRHGEVTDRLKAEGWDVSLRWKSDTDFGVLATKLEAKQT